MFHRSAGSTLRSITAQPSMLMAVLTLIFIILFHRHPTVSSLATIGTLLMCPPSLAINGPTSGSGESGSAYFLIMGVQAFLTIPSNYPTSAVKDPSPRLSIVIAASRPPLIQRWTAPLSLDQLPPIFFLQTFSRFASSSRIYCAILPET